MTNAARFSGLVVSFVFLFLVGTACKSGHNESAPIHLLQQDRGAFYSYLRDLGVDNDPDKVFTLTNGVLRMNVRATTFIGRIEERGASQNGCASSPRPLPVPLLRPTEARAGVQEVKIGVPQGAALEPANQRPAGVKPIVFLREENQRGRIRSCVLV